MKMRKSLVGLLKICVNFKLIQKYKDGGNFGSVAFQDIDIILAL